MTFFFNFVSNNTKDIFEIVSDWNDVISFITTMVGVAVTFFSSFCFIKIINMEDINEKVLSDLEIDNEQLDLEDFFSELEVNSVFLGPGTKRT